MNTAKELSSTISLGFKISHKMTKAAQCLWEQQTVSDLTYVILLEMEHRLYTVSDQEPETR